jgi:hypothetical protein
MVMTSLSLRFPPHPGREPQFPIHLPQRLPTLSPSSPERRPLVNAPDSPAGHNPSTGSKLAEDVDCIAGWARGQGIGRSVVLSASVDRWDGNLTRERGKSGVMVPPAVADECSTRGCTTSQRAMPTQCMLRSQAQAIRFSSDRTPPWSPSTTPADRAPIPPESRAADHHFPRAR